MIVPTRQRSWRPCELKRVAQVQRWQIPSSPFRTLSLKWDKRSSSGLVIYLVPRPRAKLYARSSRQRNLCRYFQCGKNGANGASSRWQRQSSAILAQRPWEMSDIPHSIPAGEKAKRWLPCEMARGTISCGCSTRMDAWRFVHDCPNCRHPVLRCSLTALLEGIRSNELAARGYRGSVHDRWVMSQCLHMASRSSQLQLGISNAVTLADR